METIQQKFAMFIGSLSPEEQRADCVQRNGPAWHCPETTTDAARTAVG
jgi:hypothetical protein